MRRPKYFYSKNPDVPMRPTVAYVYLNGAGIKIGGVRKQWTHRRFEFVKKNIPQGLTATEFLMSILDAAIIAEQDAGVK